MTAAFLWGGGLVILAAGYGLFFIGMWWATSRAPLDTDLWPGGADEPWGKPAARLKPPVRDALDATGDDVERTVFQFPAKGGVLAHQLDAEFATFDRDGDAA